MTKADACLDVLENGVLPPRLITVSATYGGRSTFRVYGTLMLLN